MAIRFKNKKHPTPDSVLREKRREAQEEMAIGVVRGPKAKAFIEQRKVMLQELERQHVNAGLKRIKEGKEPIVNTSVLEKFRPISWFSDEFAEQFPEHYALEQGLFNKWQQKGLVPPKIVRQTILRRINNSFKKKID
jgi:hypothetical protein